MESPNPDKTFLSDTYVLDDIPKELSKLLTVAQQNISQIDHLTNTASSVISNIPKPNNSPEELFTEQHELSTKSIPNSDVVQIKQGKELDGCNSNKSSVILPTTIRKRLLFDYPEKDTTSLSDLKTLCNNPINELPQVQSISKETTLYHDDPHLSGKELKKDDYVSLHNLKYLDNHLYYLVNNIYDSMPKDSSKTSPYSFCKASKHILAFKRFVIDHGKHLADNNHWSLVLDYVFIAWKHVSSTPKWDTLTHNTTRRQCFTSLLGLCMMALKNIEGDVNEQQREHYIKEFKLIGDCEDKVKMCLELLDFDFTTQ